MIKAGITGNIGSGKSTIAGIAMHLGFPVFNADLVSRDILNRKDVLNKVAVFLGDEIKLQDGSADRKKIASLVFNDESKLNQLNSVLHPEVKKAFDLWLISQKAPLVFREAAILFETGTDKDLDFVVAVTAPKDVRLKRVCQRDGLSETEVLSRMSRQWPEEEIVKRSRYVIVNDGHTPVLNQFLTVLKHSVGNVEYK